MESKVPIAFAFYKNDVLIGYRLDTIGTIKLSPPKIYYYSKSQVETVLHNIQHNVLNKEGFGKALGVKFLEETEESIHNMLQDERAFEVRVVKCPGYPIEKEFDIEQKKFVERISWEYPLEEIRAWMQNEDSHEVIETHYFSVTGLISSN